MLCKYIIHIWNKCVIPECVLFFSINDINWLQNLIKNLKNISFGKSSDI